MLKEKCMEYYLDNNFNCAECIIRAANDIYDLKITDNDLRMMAGFGAGMQCGNTCGAVSAGVAILSMLYVEKKAHESNDIRPLVVSFMRKVNMHYGSILCKDIKPQSFKPEFRCKLTIETVCDYLEETINEYNNKEIF